MLLSFIISFIIFVCCFMVHKIRWRSKYNALLPGFKMAFYDVCSGGRYVHLNEKSRRGHSIQSVLLQALIGIAKIYENNKLVCIWVAYHPLIIPLKPETAEVMLKDSAISTKGFMYKTLLPLFGEGLVTSSGVKWKCRRRMFNPCFHLDILKEFIPIFNDQANKLVTNLQKGTDDEIRDLYKPVFYCILDAMCETIMGVKVSTQDNKNMQYVEALERIKDTFITRTATWWMWPDFIFQFTECNRIFKDSSIITTEFINEVFQQKKQQYLNQGKDVTGKKRKSLLEFLLDIDDQNISDEDIKKELNTFMMAGNDTTAIAIYFALYFLGLYKDIQDNVHQEVDRIFGDNKERPIEKEDLNDMTYIECVLKETMRIYTPLPIFARTVSKDITICGYNIPHGSSCIISPYFLHRNPEAFPNPEVFDPTRFFSENNAKRHPFSYIPFSAGPRNCIGQKYAMMLMKTILSTILRHYTVESLDQRDTLDLSLSVILKPSTPLKFRIKRRF